MVVKNGYSAVQRLECWIPNTSAYKQHLLIHLSFRSASGPDKTRVKMPRLADEVDPHDNVKGGCKRAEALETSCCRTSTMYSSPVTASPTELQLAQQHSVRTHEFSETDVTQGANAEVPEKGL